MPETQPETTVYQPVKIRQPNGSALWSGGVPGNKGGGRKSAEFMRQMREACEDPRELAVVLLTIAGGPNKPFEKIAAIDTYLRHIRDDKEPTMTGEEIHFAGFRLFRERYGDRAMTGSEAAALMAEIFIECAGALAGETVASEG